MRTLTADEIKEWIRPVQDPDLGMSLVDLGLIYKCEIVDEGKVNVEMTLTSPGCPAADYLVSQVRDRLLEMPEILAAEVNLVWEPKWNPAEMASEECREMLGLW